MSWLYVDDRFHDHPKARKAGTAAIGLWVLCGAWCADYLTDGFVPAEVARRYGTARQADKLVAAGLWHAAEKDGEPGYQFHEWDTYQKTRAQVETEREKTRERVARHRARKTDGGTQQPGSSEKRTENAAKSKANRPEKNPQSSEEPQVNEDCNGVSTDAPPLPTPVLPYGSTAATRGRTRTRGTTTLAELADSAVKPSARALVDTWRNSQPEQTRHRPQVIHQLSKVVDDLLRDGGNPDLIHAALGEWDARTDVHKPAALLWLYDDAVKASRGTRSGRPDGRQTRGDKVNGWLALNDDPDAPQPKSARGDKVRGWLDLEDDQTPALTAITGGLTA